MNNYLNLEFVRSKFPALTAEPFDSIVYMDNGGAAFVPQNVVDKSSQYYINKRIQPYSPSHLSKELGEEVNSAFSKFSEFIGAADNEIIFNTSTSANFYMLSHALNSYITRNDEIIVTNLDHECNIGFWRRLASLTNATIVEWKVNDNYDLDIDTLSNLITNKTKLVALTHCSSVTGKINDIKTITKLCHENGIKVAVDGVSYAPHFRVDVKDLGIDFYSFSIYKMYGPHLGLLYVKPDNFDLLNNQSHYFFSESEVKKRFSPSGPQYGEILSAVGVLDYFKEVYYHSNNSDESKTDPSDVEIYDSVFAKIRSHEENLSNLLLKYLKDRDDAKIIGPEYIPVEGRAPNISFYLENYAASDVVRFFSERNVIINSWHFYSRRLIDEVAIDPNEGFIRLSFAHYNSITELEQSIAILDKL